MKKCVAICIMVIGLYALQPPSWEMCGETHPSITSVYDLIETPNGTLIAATSAPNVSPYTIIWRSIDGGNTWLASLNAATSSYRCYDLEITPSGRIYAIACYDYYNSPVLIYYSDDNGETWSELPQPRIPLQVVFTTYGQIHDIGIKYVNGKLYVWGPVNNPPYSSGGPWSNAEVWYYDESSSKWSKWDILTPSGFAIEKGPGPSGTHLYLGTALPSGTSKVVRINQPFIGASEKKEIKNK